MGTYWLCASVSDCLYTCQGGTPEARQWAQLDRSIAPAFSWAEWALTPDTWTGKFESLERINTMIHHRALHTSTILHTLSIDLYIRLQTSIYRPLYTDLYIQTSTYRPLYTDLYITYIELCKYYIEVCRYAKRTEMLTSGNSCKRWFLAVRMIYMCQNFRLFHVSNLFVLNFRIFLLIYSGSLAR